MQIRYLPPTGNKELDEWTARLVEQLGTVLKAAAIITDHHLVRGDGGARGVQVAAPIVSDAGEMTNPSQPAFSAHVNALQSNVTGNSVVYDIRGAIWTEIFDQGGDFSNGTFTAPITGKYLLAAVIYIYPVSARESSFKIVTSNRTYDLYIEKPTHGYPKINISIIADMDINDTAYLTITVIGGAQDVEVAATSTRFTGALIC